VGFFCLIITEFLLSIFLDTPTVRPTVPPTHTHTPHTQDDSICLESSSSLDVLQPPTPLGACEACCTHPHCIFVGDAAATTAYAQLHPHSTRVALHATASSSTMPSPTLQPASGICQDMRSTTSTPSSPRAAAAPLDLLRVHGWRRTVAAAAARYGFLNSAVGLPTQWTRGKAAIRAHSRVEVVTLLLLLIRAEFRHGGF
jgi:hypothetical protein